MSMPWAVTDLVQLARLVARAAHRNQTRRDGGDYYVNHVRRVANWVERDARFGDLSVAQTLDRIIVAELHDVVEDSTVTLTDLLQLGFPARIVEAVRALTRFGPAHAGEDGYIRYIEGVKQNPIARFVKLRDLAHNMHDNPSETQRARYLWATHYLTED